MMSLATSHRPLIELRGREVDLEVAPNARSSAVEENALIGLGEPEQVADSGSVPALDVTQHDDRSLGRRQRRNRLGDELSGLAGE